jgi:hypothetical protein
MEAAQSSEMLVSYNPEEHNLNLHCYENLQSHIKSRLWEGKGKTLNYCLCCSDGISLLTGIMKQIAIYFKYSFLSAL